jgi:cellulose synthase/poly-beta-1,6-N-acetylglucosamine synthase-like glycosyltransferase
MSWRPIVIEFLFGLGGLFLILAAHPYVTYPISLALMAKRPRFATDPDAPRPSVAICMPAYNEERVIIEKVESLLDMAERYGPASIHVYVDGSTDRTAELLGPYADRLHLVVSADRHGKTVGLKQLVAGLDAELLAFTDANVVVPPDSLNHLVAALQDPEVCCASARLIYKNRSESGISTAGAAYWNLEEFIKGLETETVSMIGVDGALFVIERSAYFAPPDELIDDLYVSMKAVLTGKRVVSEPLVKVEERNATRWEEEFRRKARISCQAMRVHRALWSELRKASPIILYCYLSHRLLKWMTPFTLTAAGLCFLAAIILAFGPVVGLGLVIGAFAILMLGAAANLPYFRAVATGLVALTGVGFGVLQALSTKETYATWTPAASVRD